jgi:GrpB-like predicted nucleotidyltransferase (UPF0157 family)
MAEPDASVYDGLGTPGGHIELAEYDPRWPEIFAYEAARIRAACPGVFARIEHIGSTSVPGLCAKPILDIMPGAASFEDGLRAVAPLVKIGYVYFGENGITGRHYYDLTVGGRVVVHVHVFALGSPDWERHLLFRDYLRAHPKTAAEYAALKRGLAARHRDERAAYTDAKSGFINAVVEQARAGRA